MTILKDLFLHIIMPFVDDIRIKGLYIDYNNNKTLPRIRQFVFEHI